MKTFLAAACAAAMLAWAPAAATQLQTAAVAQGKLVGVRQGEVAAFLGVPYATPPVGALRWRPPEPAAHWKGVRRATRFSDNCAQTINPKGGQPWTWEYGAQGKASENCLYLNVWTPAKSAGEKLPVLFWIHGGAFVVGSGDVPIYDGAALAAKGIVVVSINYRLGVFGFLAHPELSAESPNLVSGNYGLLDQIAALQWAKNNIAAFGGDPDKVTIYGQSAGSMSVVDLTLTPLAKGLFAGAIAQSGVGIGMNMPTLKDAEPLGAAFAAANGAATLKELRALSTDALLKAKPPQGEGLRFAPIDDGYVFPQSPQQLLDEGRYSDTPFMTGLTADESSAMNPKFGTMSYEECLMALGATFGAMAPQFRDAYLGKPGDACNPGMKLLARDRGQMATYRWIEQRLETAKQPIYVYFYNHVEPGTDPDRYGSFHSSDLPYVFRTLNKTPERPFAEADRAISDKVSDIWVNFVKTGDPNGPGLPAWPAADAASRMVLETGDDFRVRPVLDADRLKLMEDYIAQGGKLGMF